MTNDAVNFETVHLLSQLHGFRSGGRFMRHLRGLQKLKNIEVRELRIGTRTKLHKGDVAKVLSPIWSI
jgi:hypothetical protein